MASISTTTKKSNSQVAKDGNKAEFDFCTNRAVWTALRLYFGKGIDQIRKIPGQKKSDILVLCSDGTRYTLQIKSGTGGGRGWSCDRRTLDNLPVDSAGKTLIGNICLKKSAERPSAPLPPSLISSLLLGSDEETKPTHFVHVDSNKTTGELERITICEAEQILTSLQQEAYTNLEPKRTCVHLSPRMYLQRKGGGSKDHAPDDIQLKLKSFPDEIMKELDITMEE